MEPRKIIIAVDDSNVSKDAIEWASKTLINPNDEVHIVSVLEAPNTGEAHVGVPGESSYPIENTTCRPNPLQLERRTALLKGYRNTILQSNNTAGSGEQDIKLSALVTCLGGSTDLALKICEYSREHKPDVLIVGSRGIGSAQASLGKLFGLGSVSDFIVKHAPVPNILVHRGYHHS